MEFLDRFLGEKTERLMAQADVRIDGGRPWDLRVYNERLYRRIWANGSLGLGEAYVDGWWDCDSLDSFFSRVLEAGLSERVGKGRVVLAQLAGRFYNFQKPSRAFRIGNCHYDLGNTLYRHMLDRRMIYSCAFWDRATTLDAAQEEKLELIGRKLRLEKGMRVLDIGCGWGGAACYFAERFGVEIVGITVSVKQAKFAKEICSGLPIDIQLQDYRNLDGVYDRIYSIGMYEHVGYKNYQLFAEVVRRCLRDDGLFLLHTIGSLRRSTMIDPWINRYIFPNSMLPSAQQISESVEGLFVMEDWHNLGAHYDRTLMVWWHNFERSWKELVADYDERFHRMWRYYLLSSAGAFRARDIQLWQIVFSPKGVPGGYRRPSDRSDYERIQEIRF